MIFAVLRSVRFLFVEPLDCLRCIPEGLCPPFSDFLSPLPQTLLDFCSLKDLHRRLQLHKISVNGIGKDDLLPPAVRGPDDSHSLFDLQSTHSASLFVYMIVLFPLNFRRLPSISNVEKFVLPSKAANSMELNYGPQDL